MPSDEKGDVAWGGVAGRLHGFCLVLKIQKKETRF